MPTLEEKYAHIKKQMVFNFKIWALFIGFQLVAIIFVLLQHQDTPMTHSSRYLAFLFAIGITIISVYLPRMFLKIGFFNYHNDAGRMRAYRVYLILSLLLATGASLGILSLMYFQTIRLWYLAFWLVPFLRMWKLKPSAGVWVDFRMNHRAGRTVPVS